MQPIPLVTNRNSLNAYLTEESIPGMFYATQEWGLPADWKFDSVNCQALSRRSDVWRECYVH